MRDLEADLLLDGLLGYSARGAPRDTVAKLIAAADASGVPTLAVDILSGLDPDTGEQIDVAIRAKATVAFDRAGIDTGRLFVEGDLLRIRH
jgi:ADP-dependent NAD(P)H-hydrate dehydratase / NAD(P)H-hydrate epimerase